MLIHHVIYGFENTFKEIDFFFDIRIWSIDVSKDEKRHWFTRLLAGKDVASIT